VIGVLTAAVSGCQVSPVLSKRLMEQKGTSVNPPNKKGLGDQFRRNSKAWKDTGKVRQKEDHCQRIGKISAMKPQEIRDLGNQQILHVFALVENQPYFKDCAERQCQSMNNRNDTDYIASPLRNRSSQQ
jgi:hypothetical protein